MSQRQYERLRTASFVSRLPMIAIIRDGLAAYALEPGAYMTQAQHDEPKVKGLPVRMEAEAWEQLHRLSVATGEPQSYVLREAVELASSRIIDELQRHRAADPTKEQTT